MTIEDFCFLGIINQTGILRQKFSKIGELLENFEGVLRAPFLENNL